MLEPMGYLGLMTKPPDSSNNLNSCFQNKDFAMTKAKCVEIEDKMYVEQDTITQPQKLGRHQSATFGFWSSDFEAVAVLQRLMRADCEADSWMHPDAVLEIVPFFFYREDQLFLLYFCQDI